MRITQLAGSLLLGTMVMVGCTDNTPTELTDTPLFAQGGQGNGVQFNANPFGEFIIIDAEGDFCSAAVVADDINDFIRTNPDGSMFLHVSHGAALTFVTAGGALFQGTGRLTVSSGIAFPPGFLLSPISITASGRVTDAGGVTKQALCRATVATNKARVFDNVLR